MAHKFRITKKKKKKPPWVDWVLTFFFFFLTLMHFKNKGMAWGGGTTFLATHLHCNRFFFHKLWWNYRDHVPFMNLWHVEYPLHIWSQYSLYIWSLKFLCTVSLKITYWQTQDKSPLINRIVPDGNFNHTNS